MSEKEINEILLKEYTEAGNVTRNQEQLTRTSLSVFLPSFVALIGFLLGSSEATNWTKLGLSIAGLVVSLALLNTILRLQTYSRCYFKRAREIETLIKVEGAQVMHLYSNGEKAKHPCCTFSNKSALAFVLASASICLTISVFIYGARIACQANF